MFLSIQNGIRTTVGITVLLLMIFGFHYQRNAGFDSMQYIAYGGKIFVIFGLGMIIRVLPKCESFENSKKKRKNY